MLRKIIWGPKKAVRPFGAVTHRYSNSAEAGGYPVNRHVEPGWFARASRANIFLTLRPQ